MMKKMEFQLPDKLIIPTTYFVIANHLASKITVEEHNLIFEFDPRGFGILSPKVQKLLSDIRHPGKRLGQQEVDYSMTFDQNMLNSLFIEMSTIHKEFSMRKIMSIFDQKMQYIRMINTNLL